MLPITPTLRPIQHHGEIASYAEASEPFSQHEVQLHALVAVSELLNLDARHYTHDLTARLNQVLDTPFVTAGHIDIRSFLEHLQNTLRDTLSLDEADPLRCFLRGSIARALILNREPTPGELADIDVMFDLSDYPIRTLLAGHDPVSVFQDLIKAAIRAAATDDDIEVIFYADNTQILSNTACPKSSAEAAWIFARIPGLSANLEIFLRLKAQPLCVFAFDDLSLVIPMRQSSRAAAPNVSYCSTSFYPLRTAIDDAVHKKLTLEDLRWIPRPEALVRAFRHACQGYSIPEKYRALIVHECLNADPNILKAALRRLMHHHSSRAEQVLLPLQSSVVSSELLPEAYIPSRYCYFEKFYAENDHTLILHLIGIDLKASVAEGDTRNYDIALLSTWIAPWLTDVPLPGEFSGKLLSWQRFYITDLKRALPYIKISANLGRSIFCLRSVHNPTSSDSPTAYCRIIREGLANNLKLSSGMLWLYLSQLPLTWSTLLDWDYILSLLEDVDDNQAESCYLLRMAPQLQAWLTDSSFATITELRALLVPTTLLKICDYSTLQELNAGQLEVLYLYITSDNFESVVARTQELPLEIICKLYTEQRRAFRGPYKPDSIKESWVLLALIPLELWSDADLTWCIDQVRRDPKSSEEQHAQTSLLLNLNASYCKNGPPSHSLHQIYLLLQFRRMPFGSAVNAQALDPEQPIPKIFSKFSQLIERKGMDPAWALPIIWITNFCYASDNPPLMWHAEYEDVFLHFWFSHDEPLRASMSAISQLEQPLHDFLDALWPTTMAGAAIESTIGHALAGVLFDLGRRLEKGAPLRACLAAQIILLIHYRCQPIHDSSGKACLKEPALLWSLSMIVYHAPEHLSTEMAVHCVPWCVDATQAQRKSLNSRTRLEQLWQSLLQSLPANTPQWQQCLIWANSWDLLKGLRLYQFMRKQWLRMAQNGKELVQRISTLPDRLCDATETEIVFAICSQSDEVDPEILNMLAQFLEANPAAWHKKLKQAIEPQASLSLKCLILQTALPMLVRKELQAETCAQLLDLANIIGFMGAINQSALAGPCLILMNPEQYNQTIHEQFHEEIAHAACQLSEEVINTIPSARLASSLCTLLTSLTKLCYQPDNYVYRNLLLLLSKTIEAVPDLASPTCKSLEQHGVSLHLLMDKVEIAGNIFAYYLADGSLEAGLVIKLIEADPGKVLTILSGLCSVAIKELSSFADWSNAFLQSAIDASILPSLRKQISAGNKACQVLIEALRWASENVIDAQYHRSVFDHATVIDALIVEPDHMPLNQHRGMFNLIRILIHNLMHSPYAGHTVFMIQIGNILKWELPDPPAKHYQLPIFEEHTLVELAHINLQSRERRVPTRASARFMAACVTHSLSILGNLNIHEPWWKLILKHEQLCDDINAELIICIMQQAMKVHGKANGSKKTAFDGPQAADVLRRAILRLAGNQLDTIHEITAEAIMSATRLLERYTCLLTMDDITLRLTQLIAKHINSADFFLANETIITTLFNKTAEQPNGALDDRTRNVVAAFYFSRGVHSLVLSTMTAASEFPQSKDAVRACNLLKAFQLVHYDPCVNLMEQLELLPWFHPQNPRAEPAEELLYRTDLRQCLVPRLEMLKYLNDRCDSYFPWLLDIFAILSVPSIWRSCSNDIQEHLPQLQKWANFICDNHSELLAMAPQDLWPVNRWVYFGACLFLQRTGTVPSIDLISELINDINSADVVQIRQLESMNMLLRPEASYTYGIGCGTPVKYTVWARDRCDVMARALATLSILYIEADDILSLTRLHYRVFYESGSDIHWGHYTRLVTAIQMMDLLDLEAGRPEVFAAIGALLGDAVEFFILNKQKVHTDQQVGSSLQHDADQAFIKITYELIKTLESMYSNIWNKRRGSDIQDLFGQHLSVPTIGLYNVVQHTSDLTNQIIEAACVARQYMDAPSRLRLLRYINIAIRSSASLSKSGLRSLASTMRDIATVVSLEELQSMYAACDTIVDKALIFDWIRFRITVCDDWSIDNSSQNSVQEMLLQLITGCDQIELRENEQAVLVSILASVLPPGCSHKKLAQAITLTTPGAKVLEVTHMLKSKSNKRASKNKRVQDVQLSTTGFNQIFPLLHVWCQHVPNTTNQLPTSLDVFTKMALAALRQVALEGSPTAAWCLKTIEV